MGKPFFASGASASIMEDSTSAVKEEANAETVDLSAADDTHCAGDYEGLVYAGHIVQHFDVNRDAEEALEADKEAAAVRAKELFKNVGRNTILGAVTGCPGIVFGVGGAVA